MWHQRGNMYLVTTMWKYVYCATFYFCKYMMSLNDLQLSDIIVSQEKMSLFVSTTTFRRNLVSLLRWELLLISMMFLFSVVSFGTHVKGDLKNLFYEKRRNYLDKCSREPTEADHEALAQLTNYRKEKMKNYEARFSQIISGWSRNSMKYLI